MCVCVCVCVFYRVFILLCALCNHFCRIIVYSMYIQCIHVVQIGYFNDFYMYICLVLLEKGTSNKNTYCVYTVFVYVYQVRSLYCIYMYLHIACTVYTVFVYIHVYQVRSLYLYTKITP